jgi:Replication-relaxation
LTSRRGTRAGEALEPAAVAALLYVVHHRLLTTSQVRALRGPDASPRWTLELLATLERRGLLAHVRSHGRRKLWHATPRGTDLACSAGALPGPPRPLGAEEASGALQAHTLAVNEAGICFVRAAQERGDEVGPLSWRHEVAHPLGPRRGRSGPRLIADALLTYLLVDDHTLSLEYRLLELDRATLTVDRLAAKLTRYAQLKRAKDDRGEPAWRAWYPTFPAVHLILAAGARPTLERRRDAVLALCAADPRLAHTPGLAISICLLCDLQRHGPFAPIFLTPANPHESIDWLGRPPASRRRDTGEG